MTESDEPARDPAFYANATPEAWAAVVDAHSTVTKPVSELGVALLGGEALAPTTTATTIEGGGLEVRPVVDPTTNPF